MRYRLTDLETIHSARSWLCTVQNGDGEKREVVLVPCEDGVQAWFNRCTHEEQALYREDVGAVVRDGGIVCPKHGSVFDTCSGECENGPADGSTLPSVEVTAAKGQVYLVDDDVRYLHEGPIEDDDDDKGPASTSHLRF